MRQRAIISIFVTAALIAAVGVMEFSRAGASSHREAPGILSTPQVDGTDFYMFRSYEEGRDGFVTLIANYIPLQDPYGPIRTRDTKFTSRMTAMPKKTSLSAFNFKRNFGYPRSTWTLAARAWMFLW